MRFETSIERLLLSTMRIVTPLSVGTGVIVEHRWGDGNRGTFLVTNKHVVESTPYGTLTFTTAPERHGPLYPEPDLRRHVATHMEGKAWNWVGHPSDDIDVTALAISHLLDGLWKEEEKPYYQPLLTSMFPSADAFGQMDSIEDLLFIGYPNGVYDKTNNLPIVRRGLAATPIHLDYEGKPVFLIDASVFPGSSGSPVFIYNSGVWSDRGKVTVAGTRVYLLGIIASVFFRESDGSITFKEIPSSMRPVVTTQEMIDLGVVYKVRTILETIEHLLRLHGENSNSSPS